MTTHERLTATAADLPPGVAATLADPPPGEHGTVDTESRRWTTVAWGDPADPPVLLVHGVASNAGVWWRVGAALAAAGRRVVAVDMPGHGPDGALGGRFRFADTAEDLAWFTRAAGLDRPELAIVGHSWGAMVAAHLPAAGIRARTLVLLDPPALTLAGLEEITRQPTEQRYDTMEAATEAVRTASPSWSEGDVEAKARALTELHPELVLAVLLRNGDWDAGIAALRHPAAANVDAWLIRGDWDAGGLIADSEVPAFEAQLGADHVVTIAGGPHSPQRTHPEATILAILRALA